MDRRVSVLGHLSEKVPGTERVQFDVIRLGFHDVIHKALACCIQCNSLFLSYTLIHATHRRDLLTYFTRSVFVSGNVILPRKKTNKYKAKTGKKQIKSTYKPLNELAHY